MNSTILLRHLRSTKGAEVYEEIDKDGTVLKGDNSLVGILYLRKVKLDGTAPQELKVTIESEAQ